jgi:23S rRNA (pseudouridine1915-N3)-methyltransferase
MKINLLAVGSRLDDWINTGFQTYTQRLPRDFSLQLKEIPAIKRHKGINPDTVMEQESQRLLAAIPDNHLVIALDRTGEQIDTLALAQKLLRWHNESQSICFLIGGPEGLAPSCLNKADWIWSLSKLTLPHPLVRVVLAEQIYRAWSIITHHPYHR